MGNRGSEVRNLLTFIHFHKQDQRVCYECYAIYVPTRSSYLHFKNTLSLSPPMLSMIFEVKAFVADRLISVGRASFPQQRVSSTCCSLYPQPENVFT